MARVGINKEVVQQARQALLARGEHPSIDAVRIELGNTGSKTTIHRYLKELGSLQPATPKGTAALSEPLGRLVEQLARQLQQEADLRIEAAEVAFSQQREQLEARFQLAQQALAATHQQLQVQTQALEAASEKLGTTQRTLQTEQLRNASLSQSLGELKVRLADKDEQILSLEEKHRHARDALEQEQRRHEAQLKQLQAQVRQLQQGLMFKQDELTRLHRDNERMLAEQRQSTREREILDSVLEQRDAQIQGLRTILAQAQGASDEMRRQLQSQTQQLEAKRGTCADQVRELQRLNDELKQRDQALEACQLQLKGRAQPHSKRPGA